MGDYIKDKNGDWVEVPGELETPNVEDIGGGGYDSPQNSSGGYADDVEGGFFRAIPATVRLGVINSISRWLRTFKYSGEILSEAEKRSYLTAAEMRSGDFTGDYDLGHIQAKQDIARKRERDEKISDSSWFGALIGYYLQPFDIGVAFAIFAATTAVIAGIATAPVTAGVGVGAALTAFIAKKVAFSVGKNAVKGPMKFTFGALKKAFDSGVSAIQKLGVSEVVSTRIVGVTTPLVVSNVSTLAISGTLRKALGEDITYGQIAMESALGGTIGGTFGIIIGSTTRGRLFQGAVEPKIGFGNTTRRMFEQVKDNMLVQSGYQLKQGKRLGKKRFHAYASFAGPGGKTHSVVYDFKVDDVEEFSKAMYEASLRTGFFIDEKTGLTSFEAFGKTFVSEGFPLGKVSGVHHIAPKNPDIDSRAYQEIRKQLDEKFPSKVLLNDANIEDIVDILDGSGAVRKTVVRPEAVGTSRIHGIVFHNRPGDNGSDLTALGLVSPTSKISRNNFNSSIGVIGSKKDYDRAVKNKASGILENDIRFDTPGSLLGAFYHSFFVHMSVAVRTVAGRRVKLQSVSSSDKHSGSARIFTDDDGKVFLNFTDNVVTKRRFGEDLRGIPQGSLIVRIHPDVERGIRPYALSDSNFNVLSNDFIFPLDNIGGESYNVFYRVGRIRATPTRVVDEKVADAVRSFSDPSRQANVLADLPKHVQAVIKASSRNDAPKLAIITDKFYTLMGAFKDGVTNGSGGSWVYNRVLSILNRIQNRPFTTPLEKKIYNDFTQWVGANALLIGEALDSLWTKTGFRGARGYITALGNLTGQAARTFHIAYLRLGIRGAEAKKRFHKLAHKYIAGEEVNLDFLTKEQRAYVVDLKKFHTGVEADYSVGSPNIGFGGEGASLGVDLLIDNLRLSRKGIIGYTKDGVLVAPLRAFLRSSIAEESKLGKKILSDVKLGELIDKGFVDLVDALGNNDHPLEFVEFIKYLKQFHKDVYDDVFFSSAPHEILPRQAAYFGASQARYAMFGTSHKGEFQDLMTELFKVLGMKNKDTAGVTLNMIENALGMPTSDNRLRRHKSLRDILQLTGALSGFRFLNFAGWYDLGPMMRSVAWAAEGIIPEISNKLSRSFKRSKILKNVTADDLEDMVAIRDAMPETITDMASGVQANVFGLTFQEAVGTSLITRRISDAANAVTGIKAGYAFTGRVSNVFTNITTANTFIKAWRIAKLQAFKLGVKVDGNYNVDKIVDVLGKKVTRVIRDGKTIVSDSYTALDQSVPTRIYEVLLLTQMSMRRVVEMMAAMEKALGRQITKYSDLGDLDSGKLSSQVKSVINEMSAILSESIKKRPFSTDLPSFLQGTATSKYFTQYRSYLFASNRADLLLRLAAPNPIFGLYLAGFGSAIAHELNDYRASYAGRGPELKRADLSDLRVSLNDLSNTTDLGMFAYVLNAATSFDDFARDVLGDAPSLTFLSDTFNAVAQSVERRSWRPIGRYFNNLFLANNVMAVVFGLSEEMKRVKEANARDFRRRRR